MPTFTQESKTETAALISRLRKTQARLVQELDAAQGELYQLCAENDGLKEQLAAAQQVAQGWEAQTQEQLSQLSQLKGILIESANWGMEEEGREEGDGAPSPMAEKGAGSAPE